MARPFRFVFGLALIAAASSVSLASHAAAARSRSAEWPSGQTAFHIDRQDLAQALVALAVRSGRNIVFTPGSVAGRISRPVVGTYSLRRAIEILCDGSGLKALLRSDGSILIVPASDPASPGAAATLRRWTGAPPSDAGPATVTVVAAHRIDLYRDARWAVLTPEDIEHAPDQNVAEALGREPGVTVLDGGPGATNSVGVDLPARARGNYISVRGFDASYNRIEINGVGVAESQPYSRGVQLDLLPAAGLQRIVIDKSLSADQDGDAVGGVFDFRTPTAFDVDPPVHAALSLGARAESEAARNGRNPYGGSIFIEWSARFGPGEHFGLHIGGYDDKESFANGVVDGIYPATFNRAFAYTTSDDQGRSAPGLDPARNLTLTGLDTGVTLGQVRRRGGDLSFDWRPGGDTSAYARATFARSVTDQASAYLQTYGNAVGVQATGNGLFAPNIAYVQPRYYWETNPETSVLGSAQIGGQTRLGALRSAGSLFFTWGETNDPDHFEISGRQPEVAPGLPFGASQLFSYVGGVPQPNLSATDLASIADVASYGARRAGEVTEEYSRQLKYGAKLDFEWPIDSGVFKAFAFGLKYQRAVRQHTVRDYTAASLYSTDADDPSLGSLGLFAGSVKAAGPGIYGFPLPLISQSAALTLFNTNIQKTYGGLAGASDECGSLSINNYNCDTQHGVEAVAAFYVLSRVQIGAVELESGMRFERTAVTNRFWVLPQTPDGAEAPGYFADSRTIYNKPLPRLSATWRPDPDMVVRAAAWAAYVRPSPFQLGGGTQIVNTGGGVAHGGTTTITQGNPDLKTVDTLNLDLSMDWSGPHQLQAATSVFYKAIDHFIFDTVNGYSGATGVVTNGALLVEPHNGGRGRVYGLEFAGRAPLSALSRKLAGLSIDANVTWEHSEVDTGLSGLSPRERLLNQPNLQTNLRLSWTNGPASVDLVHRWIGAYVSQYATLGPDSTLDTWVRGSRRVDLTASYRTPFGVRLVASVTNLFHDRYYEATIGAHTATIPSIVDAGRTYMLQTRVTY
jgi:TonB-dependent receptor